jgi:hypothetical protein
MLYSLKVHNPSPLLLLLASQTTLHLPSSAADFEYYEDGMLAIGSLIGWHYMLFFAMGFRHTGPFVVMIYHMLIYDISRFSMIYMIFMIGFAQCFYIIQ